MLPKSIRPMLAVAAPAPFDSDDYLFEVKWDGIRCLAFIEAGKVRLQSRDLVDITARFPELSGLAGLPSGTVLDGELVVFDKGRPSWSRVVRRAQMTDTARIDLLSRHQPAVLVAFDLLYCSGRTLMQESLTTRRSVLQEMMKVPPSPQVIISEAVRGAGIRLFAEVQALGWEGIMAKSIEGRYAPGRRVVAWRKIKTKSATHK